MISKWFRWCPIGMSAAVMFDGVIDGVRDGVSDDVSDDVSIGVSDGAPERLYEG
jgi:hypothetical protein